MPNEHGLKVKPVSPTPPEEEAVEPPVAGFSLAQTGPVTYQFTNSSQNASSYLWDFGDASSIVLPNPSHTYWEF